mmetsp:Transcript_14065/g.27202  ORF Transcript_14065/g.27202 Transcript_14065/m.27202 type:complete len:586 (-) Transcript_14065:179-1936(-)
MPAVTRPAQSSRRVAPLVEQVRSAISLRQPVTAPKVACTWEDEFWRIRRIYEENPAFGAEEGEGGERVLRLTHLCSDPDWEAINWAPDGLVFEIGVPATYPEELSPPPVMLNVGPARLPERFRQLVPCLFGEVAARAPANNNVYRALQHVDRNLTMLWLKLQAATERVEKERRAELQAEREKIRQQELAAEQAQKRAATWSDEDQRLLEAAIEEFGNEPDFKRRWNLVAQRVGGGHTAKSCAERYRLCRDFALGKVERLELVGNRGDEAEAASSATSTVVWSAEHVRRQGIEVRLLGLQLEGFSTLLLETLRLQVVCGRCKKPSDIFAECDSTKVSSAEHPCSVCRQKLELRVAPRICHGGSTAIAHVLGMNCHPVQYLRSNFVATCGECAKDVNINDAGPGHRRRGDCPGCFTKVNICIEGDELLGPGVAHWRQVAADENDKMNSRRQLKDARQTESKSGIKAGQPLPNNGACKHYSKSFRWLRFPCCGKAFPCVDCHDEQMDHVHEWATRMLCGACSHEQPYSKDKCQRCGATQTRPKSTFWEGGEGCRNKATMSKNDSHKYKGMNKTVPQPKSGVKKRAGGK